MSHDLRESTSNNTPIFSAVVETANTPPGDYRELDLTLEALNRQTFPADRFEVLIVADPRLHPTLREHAAKVAPQARVLDAPGLHYYGQKNLGARESRGEIVGFMDSDCIPASTWAASIVDAFARNDDRLGAVQGTVWSDRSVPGYAFVITNFGLLQARAERRTSQLTGNNCAFRRADILSVPFDETPVFHGPDVKMAAQIAGQGRYILLVPGAANHHHFLPGFKLSWGHGVYWGYCFLETRRRAAAPVPYARLFRWLGPIAPLALVPAKSLIDLRRLAQRRADLDLEAREVIGCAAALLVNSFAVGLGALRSVLRLPPPTSATSSNAHMTMLQAAGDV